MQVNITKQFRFNYLQLKHSLGLHCFYMNISFS